MKPQPMLRISAVLVWMVLTLLAAIPAVAQTGKISGKVVDQQSRQPLPGVNVIIEGTTMGAATDKEGDYFILNVPPGAYSIQASMVGYATQTQTDAQVQMDRTLIVDFQMGTQAVQGEEVTISAEREIIKMDIAGSTTHIEGDEIVIAPITVVADYLKIQDGVEYTRNGQGKWLSVRGGERDETDFMLDGQSTMDALQSTAYMGVSKTAIKEVSIQTGGFNAEYGRARSGLVNVVTRDGSRQEYSLALEGKYSFPHLKHFGRNMFDRQGTIYSTRVGSNNFIPGEFNGASFTPTGEPTIMGSAGEVIIDENSPEYRGWFLEPATYDENSVQLTPPTYKDKAGVLYTEAELAQYGMEPLYRFPNYFEWEGYKSLADAGALGRLDAETVYPADVMAMWMNEHQGMEYGQDPDYDLDVTMTGPLPGEQMHNKLGDILSSSTFMLAYRTQTSRFVFPGDRKQYRDRNLQAKITSSIKPTTKLRISALYGEAASANNPGPGIGGQGGSVQTTSEWTQDALNGAVESVSGVQGGGRIGNSINRGTNDWFNEGDNALNNTYRFQASAKLTHTVSPSTYFEMEYQFSNSAFNYNPIWNQDVYGDYSWVFNIDGLVNERGEPRTFITHDPNDIFPSGVSQRFDPVRRDLMGDAAGDWSLLPPDMVNGRDVPFSSGGYGTWDYSNELVESWFDDRFKNDANIRKGPNRLDMVRGFDAIGEPVEWEDPSLRPGSFDIWQVNNVRRLPDLFNPAYGGLMYANTNPGITLVGSYWQNGGHRSGDDNKGVDGLWSLYHDGRQILRSNARMNSGRATIVSQLTKHNQIKAGFDIRFWNVFQAMTHCNGGCEFPFNETVSDDDIRIGAANYFDVRGNWNARQWNQFDDNPMEFSAFLQDKIEVQGLIANIGMRLDVFDPTAKTIDFGNPFRPQFGNQGLDDETPDRGPSHFNTGTDKVKSQVVFKWSPRIGLSFPVTETSKVYFNYGWFFQRPTFQQYYQFIHYEVGNGIAPLTYPNSNLDWPRTIQMEMGYEQNVKGWFLVHAAGYYKDSDELIDQYEWQNISNTQILRSLVNNNWSDIRGLELRIDKNYGLFRARLNYNYMIKTRGQSGGEKTFEDLILQLTQDQSVVRSIADIHPEPTPSARATAGFFTPRNWGPKIGEKFHPLDNIVINMIYQWRSKGQRRHFTDSVRPDRDVWVDLVPYSNTDLRAEKDIPLGRQMRLGLFVQVYNLWNQKLLIPPNNNGNGVPQDNRDAYDSNFRYDTKYYSSVPPGNDKWGEYKPAHLSRTLPWFFDYTMFEDKRDVFYGLTFTFN